MAESLCCFCKQGDLGVEKAGETFRKDGVTVHENCLVKICKSFWEGPRSQVVSFYVPRPPSEKNFRGVSR